MRVYIRINAFAIGEPGMPYRYAYQNKSCPQNWAQYNCDGNFGEDFAEDSEDTFDVHTVSAIEFSDANYKAFRRWYDKYINNLPIKQVTEKENQ